MRSAVELAVYTFFSVRLGVLREAAAKENRVALVPAGIEALSRLGFETVVAAGAGEASGAPDSDYEAAGATIAANSDAYGADVVVSVRDLADGIVPSDPASGAATFIGVLDPLWAPQRAERHALAGTTAFALDLVPRITRAQSMDVLSSMGTIAGYEAALLAAIRLPQMFPLMMTAAGTLKPARVLVLGAGVAGLQAIATARRLGAVVEAYDVRAAAAEQIRSMGARAVELDLSNVGVSAAAAEDAGGYAKAQSDAVAARQQELLAPHVAEADVVISTAAIPGRASPLLVTAAMLEGMRPGSVLVDLAAERGGNCEVTEAGGEIEHRGVTVMGPTDLVSRSARHSSQMFSRNLVSFLTHLAGLVPEGTNIAEIDATSDEILSAMLVAQGGRVTHDGVADALSNARAGSSQT